MDYNPIDKDKITETPSLLPYAHTIGGVVIRPEDVGPNSTVQSRRLANAQIAYRGSGDLANATKAGWGTSLMHKFWPF